VERAFCNSGRNPHFIFNCLNSIQHFILSNEPTTAVRYLAKFARLVRDALETSVAGQVMLNEEVRMLDNYLALEQMRFKQAFDYHLEVDERLDHLHTVLPPLIVQPFVENAVQHGMKNREHGGLVRVVFRPDGAFLCIEVQDNGTGMTIAPAGDRHDGNKSSLGRGITQRRLELLQEQTVSVAYTAPADSTGMLVTIRLPLTTVQDDR